MTDLESKVPEHILPSIIAYVKQGRPVGGFLNAVLSNNLLESFKRADDINCIHMFDIVNYLYNEAPSTCWGSPEKVEIWLKMHRESKK